MVRAARVRSCAPPDEIGLDHGRQAPDTVSNSHKYRTCAMAYHSLFNDTPPGTTTACGLPLLPLRPASPVPDGSAGLHLSADDTGGPGLQRDAGAQAGAAAHAARKHVDPVAPDIVDEALDFYRANAFATSYGAQGGADLLLIYISLFTAACLQRGCPPGGRCCECIRLQGSRQCAGVPRTPC